MYTKEYICEQQAENKKEKNLMHGMVLQWRQPIRSELNEGAQRMGWAGGWSLVSLFCVIGRCILPSFSVCLELEAEKRTQNKHQKTIYKKHRLRTPLIFQILKFWKLYIYILIYLIYWGSNNSALCAIQQQKQKINLERFRFLHSKHSCFLFYYSQFLALLLVADFLFRWVSIFN